MTALTPSDDPTSAAPRPAEDFILTFGDRELEVVRQLYQEASAILEYGSGGSTVLAAELAKTVTSVESDKAWADRLTARLAGFPNARVVYVDIGPTGAWGFPARAKSHETFHRYALSVWDDPLMPQPDLVLVDGRFRAACLAATKLRTNTPVTLLFDDYAKRRYYHRVERLATLDQMVGRMAVFTVEPGPIPPDMLTEVVGWFSDPR